MSKVPQLFSSCQSPKGLVRTNKHRRKSTGVESVSYVSCSFCTNPRSVDDILLERPVTTELFLKDAYAFTACNNVRDINDILLECPVTTELFLKDAYAFTACNNVRDILYNIDIIAFIVNLVVHSPVGKLMQLTNI